MPAADVFVVPRPGGTGTPAELENANVLSIEWRRNRPDLLDFFVPKTDPKVFAPKLLENEVQVWINGALEYGFWGYPHRAVNTPKGSRFSCESLLGYFAGRHVLTDLVYTQLEQRTIAWNLVNYAQSGADQALGITSGAIVGVTKLRDKTYTAERKISVLEAVTAFSKMIDGFDVSVEIFGDGRREFTCHHPTKGTARPALGFEWGRNLDNYTHVEEALPGVFANRAIVAGPVNEGVRLEGDVRDATSATKHGEWQIVLSDGSEGTTQDWITDRATQEVTQRKAVFSEVDLTAVEVPVALLGVIRTGDTCPVRIKDGRADVATTLRIEAIKWTPPKNLLEIGVRA